MPSDQPCYPPGTVADMTGLSIHTLRYYEKIGLLDEVARNASGHRRYSPLDVRRLEFIKRMRATDMPIEEIKRYIELYQSPDNTLEERSQMLEEQRDRLQQQLAELRETLAFLEYKIDLYRNQQDCVQNIKDSDLPQPTHSLNGGHSA